MVAITLFFENSCVVNSCSTLKKLHFQELIGCSFFNENNERKMLQYI